MNITKLLSEFLPNFLSFINKLYDKLFEPIEIFGANISLLSLIGSSLLTLIIAKFIANLVRG